MLVIRLTRKGKKNQPFFRVVVIDKKRSSKGGRAVEDLGFVDPLNKRKSVNKERAQYWISKGAQPSDTIHNLLVSEKIIEGKKINLFTKTKKAKEAEIKAAAADAAATAAKPKPEADQPKAEASVVEAPAPEAPAEAPVEAPKEAEAKPEETKG